MDLCSEHILKEHHFLRKPMATKIFKEKRQSETQINIELNLKCKIMLTLTWWHAVKDMKIKEKERNYKNKF